MLHDGIGVPRVGIEGLTGSKNTTKSMLDNAKENGFLDPFHAVNKIKDTEVSWTLGKMVLYASSEIPPPDEKALAVGFGSNVPGIPADFQYPGGVPVVYQSENDWHRLFVENPQRIPAFFIMMFMVIFIICLILGKERRAVAFKTLTSLLPKKQGKDPLHRRRRGFPLKMFGLGSSGGQTYERVDLEDGTAANEFELEETHLDSSDNELSDSSDGSRLGRTSGWATPQTKADAPGASPFFGTGDVLTQGVGLGMGPPSAFNRAGLMSRTESSERIRSRASSPKRAKGGLEKLDE